jgi:hypothetical protein
MSRWLIFRGPMRGQGIGQTAFGLSAALHHALLHHRKLCVAWKAFEIAFKNPDNCPSKGEYFVLSTSGTALLDADAAFEEWSFDEHGLPAPTVAANIQRRDALLNSSRRIVIMHGDGGLKAPGGHPSPHVFPFMPRNELLALIGGSARSRLVVHLRLGDPHEGHRRGYLSEPSALETLRTMLPSDAYCLSDAEEVYSALCSHLACPSWRNLPHSSERAMRPSVGEHRLATLQTWADWWSIRSATGLVLHTPSAFPESALRFNMEAESCVMRDAASAATCIARAADESSEARLRAAQRLEL